MDVAIYSHGQAETSLSSLVASKRLNGLA